MSLYLFPQNEDPGSSFADLLRKVHPDGAVVGGDGDMISVPHGTTIAALRYHGGIVMAGDRRATEGVSIAHRGIEKVFAADRFSAVAIAGAAGPAIEMVR